MHISQQQEQFSRAYVHAIASVAGFTLYIPQVDDDSVDLGIAQWQGNYTFTSFRNAAEMHVLSQIRNQFAELQLSIKA